MSVVFRVSGFSLRKFRMPAKKNSHTKGLACRVKSHCACAQLPVDSSFEKSKGFQWAFVQLISPCVLC